MKILYIDCSNGISARALLGALVDLGIEQHSLATLIRKNTGEDAPALTFKKAVIQNMTSTSVVLDVPGDSKPVPVINFINTQFRNSSRSDAVFNALTKVFMKYTAARSKVLNISPENVTEEKGVIFQASVICAGTFAALEMLDINRIIASPLPIYQQSSGVSGAAQDPFVLELARGARVRHTQCSNIAISALGVALLSACVDQYGHLPEMVIDQIGYGANTCNGKDIAAMRVLTGKAQNNNTAGGEDETIIVLETGIDDMNPEFFPHIVERLLNLGVLDAFLTPVYMKKGRPAYLLTVLCRKETVDQALEAIFRESTTLGVRIREEKRRVLKREFFKVSTPYGEISVKSGFLGPNKELVQMAPEFEDCKQIAMKLQVPIKEVYAAAQLAAIESSKKPGS